MKNRFVGYIRVSTDKQSQEGISLEAQEKRIRNYAEINGIELICILVDEGESGGVPIYNRTAGSRIKSMIDNKEIDGVIVVKLDRAFRSTVDAIQTIEQWNKAQIGLIILDLGGSVVDTTSAIGKFFITMISAFGELEKEQTRERTKAALHHKRNTRQVYCQSVYGFDRVEDRLERNKEEQAAIKAMITARNHGCTFQAISNALNESGIPSKKGGEWSKKVVSNVISNADVHDYDDLEPVSLKVFCKPSLEWITTQ